jgi:ribosomal 50S subunit-recycling heat shock protein
MIKRTPATGDRASVDGGRVTVNRQRLKNSTQMPWVIAGTLSSRTPAKREYFRAGGAEM